MGSRSNRIYLLLWGVLISITIIGAVLIPRFLDGSKESGYHELQSQNKAPLASLADPLATNFPVRPIIDIEPKDDQPKRQAFPELDSRDEIVDAKDDSRPKVGLPQRTRTEGEVADTPAPVTSRVQVLTDSSVYEKPLTTASVIGTARAGVWVRWTKTIDSRWEEIVLSDGRLVYLPSGTLALPGSSIQRTSRQSEPELSELPRTAADFIVQLQRSDVSRAATYLASSAPSLAGSSLDAWKGLIGAGSKSSVGRIEPIPGEPNSLRAVEIIDQASGASLQTIWEWNPEQRRWLLTSWGS